MKLSIIIVSWNVKDLLRENLESIFQNKPGFEFEVFLVDNNSEDGTVEMVRKNFPQVNLIANQENLGFARANNQAIKKSQGEYVLLLNPDMKVLPSTLDNLVKEAEKHNEAGILGGHLVDKQGETVPQVRKLPGLWDQLAIILKIPHLFPGVLNKYLVKGFNYTREAEVDSIRGSFFLIKRGVIEKVGGLDERFFLWFEEVDYCKRVREAGWKIIYTPNVECIDNVGKSFSQVKRGRAQKYFRDSMLKYFRKWKPGWQYCFLKLIWPLGLLITYIFGKAQIKSRSF